MARLGGQAVRAAGSGRGVLGGGWPSLPGPMPTRYHCHDMDGQMSEIDVLIRARYSLLYVVSWEERRVLEALREIVVGQDKNFYTWSETMGLRDGTKAVGAGAADRGTRDPLQVLDTIRSAHEPAVYVLKDFHVFLNHNYPHASAVIRKLRDLADALHTAYATVILLSPVLQLPEELKKDVTVIDYDMPGLRELDGLLTRALDSVRGQQGLEANLSAEQRERVLKAALGRGPGLEVFGNDYPTPDGTCVRDYVHISDLADAHERALDILREGRSEKFNLGNGSGFSVLEVIETAGKVVGRPIPHRTSARREGDPAVLVASSAKAGEILGWRPQYASLESIVESAWKWHSAHPDGYESG